MREGRATAAPSNAASHPAGTAPPSAGTAAAPRRRRTARAILVAGCVAACVFVLGFAVFLASIERTERDPASGSDAIVALTGGAQRIEDAVELLAKGFGSRLLITGVNERTSRDEIARLTPGQRNLVECCVDLDYRAQNTVGNAVEIGRWARTNRFRSLIVVTSNYHMPRALAELDRILPEMRKVPHAVVASGDSDWLASPTRLRLLLSEYVKYVAVIARAQFPSNGFEARSAAAEPVQVSPVKGDPHTDGRRAAQLPRS